MSELTLVVEFQIKPGRLDEFKAVARRFIERSDSEEGTLLYDWHISDDGLQGVNLERFRDSDAFLVHHRHVADIAPDMGANATVDRFHVIGEPSDEARTELTGTATGVFERFAGVNR